MHVYGAQYLPYATNRDFYLFRFFLFFEYNIYRHAKSSRLVKRNSLLTQYREIRVEYIYMICVEKKKSYTIFS